MVEPTSVVGPASAIAKPFISLAVDLFVKPKLQEIVRERKGRNGDSLVKTFEEYLNRAYEKYAYVPILVFQNQQRLLDDVYVPLTVRLNREHEEIKITGYSDDFIPEYNRVLLSDTAGMGKSTLMRKLFLSCLELHKGVPVFIELRKLRRDDKVENFIVDSLNAIDKKFDTELVMNLIADGHFVFFFDGYDEIAREDKRSVVKNLHDFIEKAGKNKFILTSRPDPSLSSFPGFMEFDIRPLQPEEARTLLKKYDPTGAISEAIIKRLKGDDGKRVSEFLTNPLLVSLLFKAYEYKRTIPLRKSNFYRQVFDALYENHDLTKDGWNTREKACRLQIDDFHAVLRGIGFKSLRKGIEYSKDELLAFINAAKVQMGLTDFSASSFLDDLLQAVPVITRDGNSFKWSHKSLQEYFAAQFVWLDSGKRKETILREMLESQENWTYVNVIDLFADMDPKTYRRVIVRDAAIQFQQHLKASPKQNISEKVKLDDESYLVIRTLTFGWSGFVFGEHLTTDLGLTKFGRRISDHSHEVYAFLKKRGVAIDLSKNRLDYMVSWESGTAALIFRDSHELHSSVVMTALGKSIRNLKISGSGTDKFPSFAAMTTRQIILEGERAVSWPRVLLTVLARRDQRNPLPIVSVEDLSKLIAEIDAEIEESDSSDFFEKF